MPRTTNRNLTIVQAMRESLRDEMDADPEVFVMGEDIRIGGSFLFTLGLVDDYGPDRVLNTPISEAGFVGLAIGAATQGMRPVVDFQYGDFLFTAADQIIQQGAKLRYMSGGQVRVPMVLQLPTGASGRGAQHANSLESYFFGVPGIKIVTPAFAYDAKGLFSSAVRDDNIVLFCVHKHLYGSKGRKLTASSTSEVPDERYEIPLGVAAVVREGSDVTVVANSLPLHNVLEAVSDLAGHEISVEVIDPRTIVPFDVDTVVRSVEKTRRLLIVEENHDRGGWGPYLATHVVDRAFPSLAAPIQRLCLPDTPIPFSPTLEASLIPTATEIKKAIIEVAG